MTTSIREIRKQRGLTLQQLADQVGTTPQTIQRLETGSMSVSVDWLERIASALKLAPADLLLPTVRQWRLPLAGHLTGSGVVEAGSGSTYGLSDAAGQALPEPPSLTIDIPADNCVAVVVKAAHAHFETGTILIGRRQDDTGPISQDCDCLVALDTGELVLLRVKQTAGGSLTLTAYDPLATGPPPIRVAWIAPIYMIVRYM
jgi:DNA-binding XRE family transcriptional regulator